jgi:hypothetical protein
MKEKQLIVLLKGGPHFSTARFPITALALNFFDLIERRGSGLFG